MSVKTERKREQTAKLLVEVGTVGMKERNVTYFLKVLLLLLGVCVIKAHDQFSLEVKLVVLVEKGSLGMTNMQVSADISVT